MILGPDGEPILAEKPDEPVTQGLAQSEPEAPAEPPFKIGHLEISGIMETLKAVQATAAGLPLTLENMARCDLPEGVTPELAVECVRWANRISKQVKADQARERMMGNAMQLAAHTARVKTKMLKRKLASVPKDNPEDDAPGARIGTEAEPKQPHKYHPPKKRGSNRNKMAKKSRRGNR